MYHSIIIEESLNDPKVLENYKILRTKFSAKNNWHLHIIEIPESVEKFIKEIQGAMVEDKPYYFHIYDAGETLTVVFKDRIYGESKIKISREIPKFLFKSISLTMKSKLGI